MILKALADYYNRLVDDPNITIAPIGFQHKQILSIIVLNEKGKLVNLRVEDRNEGRTYLVPQEVKRSGPNAWKSANLLWDHAGYVLAYNPSNPERGKKQQKAFLNRIKSVFPEYHKNSGINAVVNFIVGKEFKAVIQHSEFKKLQDAQGNISFQLTGKTELICQSKEVQETISKSNSMQTGAHQTCLISGKLDTPARLHPIIRGVWGTDKGRGNIVAFKPPAFSSFGKSQGYNAPSGTKSVFAYTAALNYLLATERKRMQVGDASTVFWAKEAINLEADLPAYLAPKKGEEAVSYGKIRALLSAVKNGISPDEEELPFYVLGLAPNASRIAIRFWYAGNVKEIKERVAEHFEDISIVSDPKDSEFLSLHQLLLSTVPIKESERSKKISPNLGGEVARAVLTGTSYPRTLFSNTVRRCKTEQGVTYARAAVIKGFLARNARITNPTQKEVNMALDKNYDNIGYVLGRLFAVLERIQEQAQGRGLNKTIRDTYFGASSSSPLVTFKRLQDLAIHHLAKIRNSGKSTVWLEQLKQEVIGHIPPQGIPSILSLEDQGRFSIGYYHQRQNFFTKKEHETKGEE